MSKSRILLALTALAAVILTAMNASWIAPAPKGRLMLIAHRGIGQPIDRAPETANAGACNARAIRATDNMFLENTQFSMQAAIRFGARGLMLDVRSSADGQAMIFRDPTLECRTNGTGRIGDRPLAYLRALDIGYGYSADNGRNFPFRGRGVGGMLTVEEVLRAFPREILVFDLGDARAADAIVAAFGRAGVAIRPDYGFTGDAAALARLRRLTRAGWVLDRDRSDACLSGYRRTGWLGIVPASCRGTTVHLPYQGEWTFWGWPYRFFDRLAGADARLFMSLDPAGGRMVGLEQPEQLGDVPHDYAGMLLIEDMNEVGRALVN